MSYHPTRMLRSKTAGLLVAPRIFKRSVTGTDTLSVFERRPKTFLFDKAYG